MMPWMIPMTVTALMFKFMFSTKVGVINNILTGLGIISKNIEWLTNQGIAMIPVIITNIWIGIPFNMILISTGLTSIPGELYESAAIDGAGPFQQFIRITLPLMRATIESILVLGFIYTFKVYDLVYVMTSGGPVNFLAQLWAQERGLLRTAGSDFHDPDSHIGGGILTRERISDNAALLRTLRGGDYELIMQ